MTPTHPITKQGSMEQTRLSTGSAKINLMTGDNVTKKTFVVKSGDTWEYDETPELKAALAKLHGQRLQSLHDHAKTIDKLAHRYPRLLGGGITVCTYRRNNARSQRTTRQTARSGRPDH